MHHLHPVGFIANFLSTCPEVCTVDIYETATSEGIFRISERAFREMLADEQYRETPYVPAARSTSSGVTLGYGYDLGHQTAGQLRSELAPYYSDDEVERLVAVAGLKGQDAQDALIDLSDIAISEQDALNLAFDVKKRYAEDTVKIYPEVIELHPHCQGALLSLVFNRGSAKLRSASRAEMGQIQDALSKGQEHEVPAMIRAMKRVWQGKNLGGLIARREREAVLFEEGLKCNCW